MRRNRARALTPSQPVAIGVKVSPRQLPVASSSGNAEPDASLDLAQQDAAKLLPPQLLHPNEIIVLLIKPSPWYVVLSSLGSLAAIAAVTVLGAYLAQWEWPSLARQEVVLLGVAAAGVRLFWQFLEWLSRVYVLTDMRVIRVKGVLRVQVFEAPLKNLQHTECLFSIRERLFGLGTITLSTAGTAIPEVYWSMLAKPLEVHQTILRTLNRYR